MVRTLVWGLNHYDETYEKTVEKLKSFNQLKPSNQKLKIPNKEEVRRKLMRELDAYRHDWLISVLELFACPFLLLLVYSI